MLTPTPRPLPPNAFAKFGPSKKPTTPTNQPPSGPTTPILDYNGFGFPIHPLCITPPKKEWEDGRGGGGEGRVRVGTGGVGRSGVLPPQMGVGEERSGSPVGTGGGGEEGEGGVRLCSTTFTRPRTPPTPPTSISPTAPFGAETEVERGNEEGGMRPSSTTFTRPRTLPTPPTSASPTAPPGAKVEAEREGGEKSVRPDGTAFTRTMTPPNVPAGNSPTVDSPSTDPAARPATPPSTTTCADAPPPATTRATTPPPVRQSSPPPTIDRPTTPPTTNPSTPQKTHPRPASTTSTTPLRDPPYSNTLTLHTLTLHTILAPSPSRKGEEERKAHRQLTTNIPLPTPPLSSFSSGPNQKPRRPATADGTFTPTNPPTTTTPANSSRPRTRSSSTADARLSSPAALLTDPSTNEKVKGRNEYDERLISLFPSPPPSAGLVVRTVNLNPSPSPSSPRKLRRMGGGSGSTSPRKRFSEGGGFVFPPKMVEDEGRRRRMSEVSAPRRHTNSGPRPSSATTTPPTRNHGRRTFGINTPPSLSPPSLPKEVRRTLNSPARTEPQPPLSPTKTEPQRVTFESPGRGGGRRSMLHGEEEVSFRDLSPSIELTVRRTAESSRSRRRTRGRKESQVQMQGRRPSWGVDGGAVVVESVQRGSGVEGVVGAAAAAAAAVQVQRESVTEGSGVRVSRRVSGKDVPVEGGLELEGRGSGEAEMQPTVVEGKTYIRQSEVRIVELKEDISVELRRFVMGLREEGWEAAGGADGWDMGREREGYLDGLDGGMGGGRWSFIERLVVA